jgi:L-seryl-tRNA(Ser) seleniumtransferase
MPVMATPNDPASALRAIPAVNEVVDRPPLAAWCDRITRDLVVEAAQAVLAEIRERLRSGADDRAPSTDAIADLVVARLEASARPPLAPAINATGVIIHTGLGRAPMAPAAVAALAEVAGGYAPVEMELADGDRGRRADLVRGLLCGLTGAESATVVNNNAAALMITLAALATDREVVVSRGELIEIGGSFRLPEVMSTGGAILREVGTTNKTRLVDYARAMDDRTAALMKVHPANYRIEGFTESVSIEDLVRLGAEHDVPVIHDIGSGALRPLDDLGIRDEPDARTSVAAGADVVLFSGDKLLGGPQAGVLVGRKAMIDRIERHPMMRALRVDKCVLAALAVTLQIHRSPELASRHVPVLALFTTSAAALEKRARAIAQRLEATGALGRCDVRESEAFLGGGSLPTHGVPSIAIELRAATCNEDELARRLRTGPIAVVPRVQGGSVWLDLRTVLPDQDELLTRAALDAIA